MTDKTAGQLSHQAAKDNNTYCAFDVSNEMVKDIESQVWECVNNNKETFDSDEFCVVMLIAGDKLLCNMIRRKFYAWPFLPKPRTSQTVWLYNKHADTVRMLWCLPPSDTMAQLTMMVNIDPSYTNMQRWSHYFFTIKFWDLIRKEHDIKMLSEEEHLEVICKKGSHSLADDVSPIATNPFDAMWSDAEEVANS